jgi:undecaprenyl-diphosphatase
VRPVPLAAAAALGLALARVWARITRAPRALALAALAFLVVYGAGVFALPDVEGALLGLGDTLGGWTYLVVGGLAFAETGLLLGLFSPGESALLLGGIVAGQGEVDLLALLVLVALACIAGDSAGFWLGRRFGRGLLERHGARLRMTPERVARVEGLLARHGGPVVFGGRFVGFIRPLAPFVAGTMRMPYARFLRWDAAGCVGWTCVYVLLGHASWQNVDRATETAGLVVAGVTALVALGALVLWRRRVRAR